MYQLPQVISGWMLLIFDPFLGQQLQFTRTLALACDKYQDKFYQQTVIAKCMSQLRERESANIRG